MTIQPINEYDIALFIGKTDLEERGLSCDALSMSDAQKMAREAFVSAGLECGKNLEIEAYASNCGVLVFARKAHPVTRVWVFSSFEEFIDALCALGEPGCKASVVHYEGKWYISTCSDFAADVLDEYAQRCERGMLFSEHLREHGVLVLDNASTCVLASYFTSRP